MNITFLIGNGFDIGMGLKSRFRDFFPIYVERSRNKSKEIRRLSERIGSDYETWADFEARMGVYTTEFGKVNKRQYIDQFRDFEKEFMEYLEREEGALHFDEERAAGRIAEGLRNFYENPNLRGQPNRQISAIFNKNRSEGHIYHFLTFNYTGVLEKCLQAIEELDGGIVAHRVYDDFVECNDKVGEIVHIHGSRDDRPIMGVNDVSQIVNAELANDEDFALYIVKPTLNSVHRTNHDEDGAQLISKSHIICIYGMSLGDTDKCWWERILQWLNGEENRQLIIFDHDDNYIESSQFDWIDKEIAIMQKLSKCVPDSEIDIRKLRPRIHIAVNKDIFQLPSKEADASKLPAPV